MDVTELAGRLRVPALILCGSRDRVTPLALSRHLNATIAGSRLSPSTARPHAPDRGTRRREPRDLSLRRVDARQLPPPPIAFARRRSR